MPGRTSQLDCRELSNAIAEQMHKLTAAVQRGDLETEKGKRGGREEERGPDMPCNGGASFFKAFAVRCLQDTSTSCTEQGSGFIKVIAGSSLPLLLFSISL